MEIGEPTRTIIVEPIEDPVPREEPERRPEDEPAPGSPVPEKSPA